MLDLLVELGDLDAEDVIDLEAPEPVRREATSLYELMLVHGATPEAARKRIVELYRRPHRAAHRRRRRSTAQAAVYPPAQCRAILRGIDRQRRAEGRAMPAGVQRACRHRSGVYSLDKPPGDLVELEAATARADDELEALTAHAPGDFWDEVTGERLPPELVRASREEELTFMEEWDVWEVVPISYCVKVTGRRPLGGRWVDVNKGDARHPVIRCRYVAKDIAFKKNDDFFSATPPLEALRFLLGHVANQRGAERLMVIDARKAHLHAHVDREVFVELPPEVAQPGFCARLKRCLYGTRDAPKRWEAYVAKVLAALGFQRGRASPCCYFHPVRGLRCVVHGDDFVLAGCPGDLQWAKGAMAEHFLTKEVGTLGVGPGEVQELRILNRVVRWCHDGVRYEADPRHAELLQAGLAGKTLGLLTPGTMSRELSADGDAELPEAQAGLFRSFAARAMYLALDRPDLAFAAKELCRRMRAPGRADLEALRRLGRYLVDSPRLVYLFRWGRPLPRLTVYGDTDFAGCRATRRSTSGGCAMWGSHLVKHWSSTQKAITLSSGEAELGGVVKAASEGLGLQSLAADLGLSVSLAICTDSSAAVGICRRAGIGKVRHLAVGQLWVQELIRSAAVELFKVRGEVNPADLLTKPLVRAVMDGHLRVLGARREAGRAASAPAASAEVNTALAAKAPWADIVDEEDE